MRKWIAMLLCVVMLFALAACGETGETANGGGMGSVNDLIAADSDYHCYEKNRACREMDFFHSGSP